MLVPVKSGELRSFTGGGRKWALVLRCGHPKYVKPKYKPLPEGEERRWRRDDEVLPHPRRSNCDACVKLYFRNCAERRKEGEDPMRSADWLAGYLEGVGG